jgi:hypothetical protein
MATLATLIAAVRLELDDEPAKIQLNGAISNTTEETVVVNSGETDKLQAGMRLEHDDATGESRRVLSVTSTTNFEAERGYLGSTAATHSDNTYMLIAPRWRYDQVSRAITTALVTMFSKGIYDIEHREITSSAVTNYYNLPAATVEEILAIYQMPSGFVEPYWLRDFSQYPLVTDTDDFASGLAVYIRENYGVAGTDIYHVLCKERPTATNVTAAQEEIVKWLACAELLEGREPRRTGGPTNQGDRTVRVSDSGRTAQFYRIKAEDLISTERQNLQTRYPSRRNFIH